MQTITPPETWSYPILGLSCVLRELFGNYWDTGRKQTFKKVTSFIFGRSVAKHICLLNSSYCYTVQVCLAHFGQLTPVQYLPFVWSLLIKWLTNHWLKIKLISVRQWLRQHFTAHYLCVNFILEKWQNYVHVHGIIFYSNNNGITIHVMYDIPR